MVVLVLAVAAILARELIWRPMIVMHRAGLGGLFAEEGRRCVGPVTEWRACSARRPRTTHSAGEQEQVVMARGTRQIRQAMREWDTLDSATSSRLRDSISIALDRWGGERTPCPPYDTSRSVAWQFDQQDVRLSTYRLPGPVGQPPTWIVQVYSGPVGYLCFAPPINARRWLTVGEMTEHFWGWITGSSD